MNGDDDGRLSVGSRFRRTEVDIDGAIMRIVKLERAFWQVRGILLIISFEIPLLAAYIASGRHF